MSLYLGQDWIRSPLDLVNVQGSATGAAVAVASIAALTGAASTGQWNVARRVTISCAVSSGSSQVPYQVFLFNATGSTGATALAGWTVSPQNTPETSLFTAGSIPYVDQNELHIPTPTAGQAMCLSGSGNMAAGTVMNLNLQAYVLGKQPVNVTILS